MNVRHHLKRLLPIVMLGGLAGCYGGGYGSGGYGGGGYSGSGGQAYNDYYAPGYSYERNYTLAFSYNDGGGNYHNDWNHGGHDGNGSWQHGDNNWQRDHNHGGNNKNVASSGNSSGHRPWKSN